MFKKIVSIAIAAMMVASTAAIAASAAETDSAAVAAAEDSAAVAAPDGDSSVGADDSGSSAVGGNSISFKADHSIWKNYKYVMLYLYEHNGDEIKEGIDWLCNELPEIQQYYKLISFDNLALEQLKVRDWVDKKVWDTCYMGDDGKYTMYLDMVKEEFAMSSISPRYKINSNSIDELFRQV